MLELCQSRSEGRRRLGHGREGITFARFGWVFDVNKSAPRPPSPQAQHSHSQSPPRPLPQANLYSFLTTRARSMDFIGSERSKTGVQGSLHVIRNGVAQENHSVDEQAERLCCNYEVRMVRFLEMCQMESDRPDVSRNELPMGKGQVPSLRVPSTCTTQNRLGSRYSRC